MDLTPAVLSMLVVLVMFGVVAAAWDIARRYAAEEVPYLNWFLLHFSIGGLGLTGVVLLASLGRISPDGVGALIGSVVAYGLGAAASRGGSSSIPTRSESRPPSQTGSGSAAGSGSAPRPVRPPVRPPVRVSPGTSLAGPVRPARPVQPAPAVRPVVRADVHAPTAPPPGASECCDEPDGAPFGPVPLLPR